MVSLDLPVVDVGLPRITAGLGFTSGGLLLPGGKAAGRAEARPAR